MNKRKMALAMAVLMAVILLIGSVGCSAQEAPNELGQLQKEMAQLQKDIGQLLEEKQEQETKKQEAAEEERMVQGVAKAVDEKLTAFEARLAEKERESRITELEKKIAELESQSADQPSWRNYPPPWPSPSPYPGSTASFRAEVYRGDFSEYVGILDNPYPISFDWGYGGPFSLTNHFSVRWEGNAYFEAGNYRFQTQADDGFRLYVDGYLLLDKWSSQTVRTHEATHYFSAGYHNIWLEYRELTGLAHVSLSWGKISP